ncbi:MAG: hypothetical protein JNL11_16940 [Bdellovibrionaceae bacterium]|nr:hypothetical protein [Pseudobdellovibrionaceae bacterium]
MKSVYKILLVVISFCYLGCSSNKDDDPSENLTMDIGSSASILIPSPASTLSCEQISKGETTAGAISGAYFTVPNPKITWKNPDNVSDVRIVVLKLTLKSPKVGGEYSCVFSDLALGSLFFRRENVGENLVVNLWDARLGPRSPNRINSTSELLTSKVVDGKTIGPTHLSCDIKCGGVSIAKNSGQFSVTGTWELLAVQKKYANESSADYEEFPIKVLGSFTVDNVLN